jgi:RHS repeat-associated protein
MLNNTDLTVGYDGIRRTTSVLHTSTTGTVDHRAFGWDGANNKDIRLNYQTGVLHRYAYDSAYRMVKSTRSKPGAPDAVVDYTLDGIGNREDVVVGYDPGLYDLSSSSPVPDDEVMNQYTDAPGDTRTYDHNGNVTSITGDRNSTLVYDYQNQLIRYEDHDAIPPQTHFYGYDALGRRFVKTVDAGGAGEESTRFFYHGWQVVEEQTPSGTTKATYVYGNGLDEVLTMNRGGNDYYYHQDDLDNVNKVTDSLGAEVESFEYSDYGLVLDAATFMPIPDPVTRTVPHGAVGNPYYFAGARLDEETGLYYMRRRYMEPWTGRFIGRDPLGIWADTANCGNAQAYAGSNPWTLKDPLGLTSIYTGIPGPSAGSGPPGGSGGGGSVGPPVAGGLWGTGKPSNTQPFEPISVPGQPPIIPIPETGTGQVANVEPGWPTDIGTPESGPIEWPRRVCKKRTFDAPQRQCGALALHVPYMARRDNLGIISDDPGIREIRAKNAQFIGPPAPQDWEGFFTAWGGALLGAGKWLTQSTTDREYDYPRDFIGPIEAGATQEPPWIALGVPNIMLFVTPVRGFGAGSGGGRLATLRSADDVLAAPSLLGGHTPTSASSFVRQLVQQGWKKGTLTRGSHAGQGLVLRETNASGQLTARMIQWHPGGGHHGPRAYWKISSPQHGTFRIFE